MKAIALFEFYPVVGAFLFPIARQTKIGRSEAAFSLFLVSLCMWPFLLYFIWDASDIKITVDRKRRTNGLKRNRCGKFLEYRSYYPDESGSFTFAARDLEEIVKKYDPKNIELLQWLHQRSESIKTRVQIPELWNLHWLDEAIETSNPRIFCSNCECEVASFKKEADSPPLGWSHIIYSCPRGHVLYRHKTVHFSGYRIDNSIDA